MGWGAVAEGHEEQCQEVRSKGDRGFLGQEMAKLILRQRGGDSR